MKGRIIGSGAKTRYLLDGEEVTKEVFDAHFPDRPMSLSGRCALNGWSRPIESDALAVHPKQIGEVMDRNKRHGLPPIEYNPVDGRPVLTSREQRRQLMKLERVHDNDGGYGDDHAVTERAVPEDLSYLDRIDL